MYPLSPKVRAYPIATSSVAPMLLDGGFALLLPNARAVCLGVDSFTLGGCLPFGGWFGHVVVGPIMLYSYARPLYSFNMHGGDEYACTGFGGHVGALKSGKA